MLLSQSKVTELHVELREFGVDVDALKQARLSEDALAYFIAPSRL